MRQNTLSKYESCKSICIKCMCVCQCTKSGCNKPNHKMVHLDGILGEHICCFRLRPNQPNQKSAFSITSAPATAGGGNIRVAKKMWYVLLTSNSWFLAAYIFHAICNMSELELSMLRAICDISESQVSMLRAICRVLELELFRACGSWNHRVCTPIWKSKIHGGESKPQNLYTKVGGEWLAGFEGAGEFREGGTASFLWCSMNLCGAPRCASAPRACGYAIAGLCLPVIGA